MKDGVSIQLSWWESIIDLLKVNSSVLIGFAVIGVMIFLVIKNGSVREGKLKFVVASTAFYYYLLITMTNVFGIPSVGSLSRMSQLGEPIVNLAIELMPFADGFSLSFLLNILAFIPIGFLVPLISPTFKTVKNTFLLGAMFSLSIEFSQIFTLYRATDINDLLTNLLGTLIGYYCFTFFKNLFLKEKGALERASNDKTKYLPPAILLVSFLTVFLGNCRSLVLK